MQVCAHGKTLPQRFLTHMPGKGNDLQLGHAFLLISPFQIYGVSTVTVPQMLTSLRTILAEIPETETFLVQIEALFITHFIDKRETSDQAPGSSSHLHEQFKEFPSHTFTTSELMDGAEVLDSEEIYSTEEQTSSSDKGFDNGSDSGKLVVAGKDVNIPPLPSATPEY